MHRVHICQLCFFPFGSKMQDFEDNEDGPTISDVQRFSYISRGKINHYFQRLSFSCIGFSLHIFLKHIT